MFRPILDRVLVKRTETPKSESLIEIPDAYQQQSNEGVIVALGDCVVLGGQVLPLSKFLSVGQKVRFGEYNAETVDKEHVLVRIQDIRGVEDVALAAGVNSTSPSSIYLVPTTQ